MSSLLEQASLIITPNGVKAGKLYGLKGTDLDVVRATTATRVNSAGLIETVANNVPRLDYTNGSCPSCLVEPQRTNLVLRSEEFDNAYWSKVGAGGGVTPVVNSNVGVSPRGDLSADRIIFSKTGTFESDFSLVTVSFTNLTNVIHNNSFYFKSFNGSTQTVRIWNITLSSFMDVALGDNWQRVNLSSLPIGGTTGFVRLGLRGNSVNNADILVWGAQLELGSNATSYIPTVASAVTRNADVISKTGLTGITTITETFENGSTNIIGGSPTSYTMSQDRIKHVIGV